MTHDPTVPHHCLNRMVIARDSLEVQKVAYSSLDKTLNQMNCSHVVSRNIQYS
jgi:hypothetical protein